MSFRPAVGSYTLQVSRCIDCELASSKGFWSAAHPCHSVLAACCSPAWRATRSTRRTRCSWRQCCGHENYQLTGNLTRVSTFMKVIPPGLESAGRRRRVHLLCSGPRASSVRVTNTYLDKHKARSTKSTLCRIFRKPWNQA